MEMDGIIVDSFKGLPHPDYFLADPGLARNMTYIHNLTFFLYYYQEPKYQAYFADGFFTFLKNTLNETNLNKNVTNL